MEAFDMEFWRAAGQTFLMATVPVIELRGALPFGMALGLPDRKSVV